MTAVSPIDGAKAHTARAFEQRLRALPNSSPALTPEERWQHGFNAFRQGEIPPSDPDEAEGWYWAENALARNNLPW